MTAARHNAPRLAAFAVVVPLNVPYVSAPWGHRAMDSLPEWAVSIIAVVVGLSPGLAIPSARRIARLLHRLLRPRPEVAGRSEHEPAQGRTGWVSSHTRVRGRHGRVC